MKSTGISNLLILTELFNAVTAIPSGIGLILSNGLGLPVSWLDNSPFHSYAIPGLILSAIVGGTNVVAAFLIWRKKRYALEASATAGFGLLIWTFSEMYIIGHNHLLQVFYFVFGIAMIIMTCLLLKSKMKIGKEHL